MENGVADASVSLPAVVSWSDGSSSSIWVEVILLIALLGVFAFLLASGVNFVFLISTPPPDALGEVVLFLLFLALTIGDIIGRLPSRGWSVVIGLTGPNS